MDLWTDITQGLPTIEYLNHSSSLIFISEKAQSELYL